MKALNRQNSDPINVETTAEKPTEVHQIAQMPSNMRLFDMDI